MKRFTRHIVVVAVIVLLAAGASINGDPEPYVVSYTDFVGVRDGERPSEFTASIDAVEGSAATLLPGARPYEAWRHPPVGQAPQTWLSLAKLKIGQQCDFFVFQFADTNGTVRFAAHRPSRIREVKYWFSVPPGPDQIPVNAIRECATDFLFTAEQLAARERHRLHVDVRAWQTESEGTVSLTDTVRPTSTPLDPRLVAGLEAAAFAAAYKANWQPTAGPADMSATLDIRASFALYLDVQVRLDGPGGPRTAIYEDIPKEKISAFLIRIFRSLHPDSPYRSFGYLGSHRARLLNWNGRLALIADDGVFRALETATGQIRWHAENPENKAHYVTKQTRQSGRHLFRVGRDLVALDSQTGQATRVAPHAPSPPQAFAVTDGCVAFARDDALMVYGPGDREWAPPIPAPRSDPLAAGNTFFILDGEGTVHALASATETVFWSVKLPDATTELHDGDTLVLASSPSSMVALSPESGSILWEKPLQDVLLCPPIACEEGFVIATKANRIALIDKSNGTESASVAWPTWIRDVVATNIAGELVVAFSDLRNRVHMLRSASLTLTQSFQCVSPLTGNLGIAPSGLAAWKNESSREDAALVDTLVEVSEDSQPLLFCTDTDGFVTMIPFLDTRRRGE